MYSRKLALSLAKRFRTCPPSEIMNDPSQKAMFEQHLVRCPYCSSRLAEEMDAWKELNGKLQDIVFSMRDLSEKDLGVGRGQLRQIKPELGAWREGEYYSPPLVLVLDITGAVSDDVLVSQTYHDVSLAGPGDLILSGEQTGLGELFAEPWNVYTLKAANLTRCFGQVKPEIVGHVKTLGDDPDAYPAWAMHPKPFEEHDVRIYFREMEVEVGYTFASRAVEDLLEELERPTLDLFYSSGEELRADIIKKAPGTRWTQEPVTFDKILALAEFAPEKLPLAADDRDGRRAVANLAMVKDGKIREFRPVPLEIYGMSGAVKISGRITGLPENIEGSGIMCFLQIEGREALPPINQEWNEETGDFLAEFRWDGEAERVRLRVVVVVDLDGR